MNDIKLGKNSIRVTFDGVTDFDYGNEAEVFCMMFLPLVGDESIIVRDGENGIEAFGAEAVNATDHQIRYFHGKGPEGGKLIRPFVKGNEAAVGAVLVIDFG